VYESNTAAYINKTSRSNLRQKMSLRAVVPSSGRPCSLPRAQELLPELTPVHREEVGCIVSSMQCDKHYATILLVCLEGNTLRHSIIQRTE
jgi:hypothetical protein